MTNAITLAESSTLSIFWWSLVLIAVLVLGWMLVSRIRRRMRAEDEYQPIGFTLSDLRQLHKQGAMTTEEFERAKEKIVEAAKRTALQDAKGAAGTRTNPQTSRSD